MLPNPAMNMPRPGPGGVPSPMKPEGGPGKDAVAQQLRALLTQAKSIAEANDLDFGQIVSEIEGAKVRPPSPPMGQPQMGG